MMTRCFLAIIIGLCGLTVYADTLNNDPEVITLLQHISEKLTSIDKRMKKLEKGEAGNQAASCSFSGNPDGPNIKKLSKIKFPENPDKEKLKKYVREIMIATKGQKCFGPEDLQVCMFKKVEHDHLDILIDALSNKLNHGVSKCDLEYAISDMVKPSDKELIIKALPKYTWLVEIVNRYGWQKDVKKVLIEKLSTGQRLPITWIIAVAGFRDPKTYGMLKEYFITNRNRLQVYEAIKDLPGLKLDDAIDEAWSMVEALPSRDIFEKLNTSIVALDFGKKKALDFLINNSSNKRYSYYKVRYIKAIRDHVDYQGSFYDLVNWYNKNKQNIVFDKKNKKFKLKSTVSNKQGEK